jgi:hypothetical protein
MPTNGYISRGTMTTVISVAGLLMLMFGGFIQYQNTVIYRDIDALHKEIRDHLLVGTHTEFQKRVDENINRINSWMHEKDLIIVPRAEHLDKWAVAQTQIDNAFKRLNEMQSQISGTAAVPLKDEVLRIETQIAEIRKLIADRPIAMPVPTK